MNYTYQYNCVCPESLEELEVIIDDMLDNITYDEFSKSVPFEDINTALGGCYQSEEQLRKDWHVRFYIGSVKFEDDIIDYAVVVWSATEFVWKLNK
jgi:hypothetical protein